MSMKTRITALLLVLVFSIAVLTGCATKAQTGAAVGAGTGALIGGLANMHGSWGATALLGAGIGAGVGYLIGNEEDKKDAVTRKQVTQDELRPFSGTAWQMVKVTPKPADPYKSQVTSFRNDGTVTTSRVYRDGRTETVTEKYRVVGKTLIINQADYVVNTQYDLRGDDLILDFGNQTVVFKRIN